MYALLQITQLVGTIIILAVCAAVFQFEFESVEYTVSEGEGSVEVCVLVSPFLATSSRVTIQTSEKTTAERPATGTRNNYAYN